MPTSLHVRPKDLWRGIQSALFYYFSCSPYLAYKYGKERERINERDRKEREIYEKENPEAYRHAPATSTNAYWAEEIRLGPGPPERKLTKKQRLARKELERATSSAATATVSSGTTPEESAPGSSVDVSRAEGQKPTQKTIPDGIPDIMRWKANQRNDEPLWGCQTPEQSPKSTPQGGSPGKQPAASPPDEEFPSLQALPVAADDHKPGDSTRWARNPQVNDLHPTVASNPAFSPISNMWMIQPPPTPAVMKGYEQPGRSRSTTASSGSTSSRKGGTSSVRLSRRLSQRLIEEKLRRPDMLYPNHLPRVPSTVKYNEESASIEAQYVGVVKPKETPEDSTATVVRGHTRVVSSPTNGIGSVEQHGADVRLNGHSRSKPRTAKHDFALSPANLKEPTNLPQTPPKSVERPATATPTRKQASKRASALPRGRPPADSADIGSPVPPSDYAVSVGYHADVETDDPDEEGDYAAIRASQAKATIERFATKLVDVHWNVKRDRRWSVDF